MTGGREARKAKPRRHDDRDEDFPMGTFLIYGANGYSGSLIAREAVKRGERPILAGRNAQAVAALATELGAEQRGFGLDDPAAIDDAIRGVGVVLNCAGPFARTAMKMAEACLRTGTHYLDITGEIEVFEALAGRDLDAKARGVMLMPGVGFDVVPTDCLAAHLKRRLPSATKLLIGIHTTGARLSRGTATTMVEGLLWGGMVRRGGVLTRVPIAWKTRVIDFGMGPVKAITIPWGDVATAYHSTGIPDIEVYMAAPLPRRIMARMVSHLRWLLGSALVQSFLKKRIQKRLPGPTDEERGHAQSFIWGEAVDDGGRRVVSRLRGPDGYTLTVLCALAVIDRVLAGKAPPGFQTPAMAYGPDFVLQMKGIVREDE